ncbi:MAG: glycosyltransferase family 2 protein [Bacteroidaceae bacterium]|nr:glycosyltransferase family 2 protein [Bacteroidaceae bacterium]
MKVSIVILNWNGADMLRRFLPSVIEHSPEAEVIVADNGSSDDSLKLLAEQFPNIRTILFDRNYGFAEGYNRAIAQVDGDLCLLLNSDVRVEAGWLKPMLDYMEQHPEVVACQPKVRCEWAPEMLEYAGACGGYIGRLGFPFCRGRILGTVERDEGQYDSIASVAWATGAALLIRRNVYLEAGGLDARFFAHQEEIDLCWRLRSRGYGIVCIPQSVIYHVGGGTLPKESPHKAYLNFRNNLLLLYKNLPEKNFRIVMHWRRLLDAAAALHFLVGGHWAACRAVLRAHLDFHRMRSNFKADRDHNLAVTVVPADQILSPINLLWQYYARRRHTFDQLPLKSKESRVKN